MILSDVSCESKNIILIMFFVMELFINIVTYLFLKEMLHFDESFQFWK